MDTQSSLFGYFVGGLALISTIVSLALYLRGYLPSAQIKVLDDLFDETNEMFEKAIVDGLLPNQTFQIRVRAKLAKINNGRESLREAAFQATSSLDDIKALLRGVSTEIMSVISALKKLRRCVITTSQMQRARCLMAAVEPDSHVPVPTEHMLRSSIVLETSFSSDQPYELPTRTPIEASSSTVGGLHFGLSSLFSNSRHESTNCSLCCLDNNSGQPSGMLDQLPSSNEVCSLSGQVHSDAN